MRFSPSSQRDLSCSYAFFRESQQTPTVCFSNSADSWQWSPLGMDQASGSPVRQDSSKSCHRRIAEPSQSCKHFVREGKLHLTSLLCERSCSAAFPLIMSRLKGNWRHYCKKFHTLVYRIGKISVVDQTGFGALPRTPVGIAMLKAVISCTGRM